MTNQTFLLCINEKFSLHLLGLVELLIVWLDLFYYTFIKLIKTRHASSPVVKAFLYELLG